MSSFIQRSTHEIPESLRRILPPHLRMLLICASEPNGARLADSLIHEYMDRFSVFEAIGAVTALSRLRDEIFDVVLICHAPGELDAVSLIDACRGSGCEEPLLVISEDGDPELADACHESGADAFLHESATTPPGLLRAIGTVVRSHRLTRENRRLRTTDQQRQQRELEEVHRLLDEQKRLLGLCNDDESGTKSCEGINPTDTWTHSESQETEGPSIPAALVGHYRELLRTHIMMGVGTLGSELGDLAELFASARISARHTAQLHLAVLEELVLGLGSRSSRHVMTRADLLLTEVLIRIAEAYRRRYETSVHRPVQRLLPGFEEWLG